MITSTTARADIARDWAVVRKLTDPVHRVVMSSGGAYNETRPEDSHNLPLVLAYAVLDQVLNELIAQGVFACRSWKLGEKMAASRPHIPWQDYDTVLAGKEARNLLAHEAILVPAKDCRRYVAAIEQELMAWAVL